VSLAARGFERVLGLLFARGFVFTSYFTGLTGEVLLSTGFSPIPSALNRFVSELDFKGADPFRTRDRFSKVSSNSN
jgi:hypothetical protein